MSTYTAFTDGSCKPNPGIGGYGVVILKDGEGFKELSWAFEGTTNNQMEIAGAVAALAAVPDESDILIVSDSKYVVNTMKYNWKRNKNQRFWNMLDSTIEDKKLNVLWEWVKGHANNKYNKRADELAQRAADDLREELSNE